MDLIFCSNDGHRSVCLLDKAIKVIEADIAKYHPLETGGILIGYYDKNLRNAVVEIALPAPPDSKHGKNFFERGIEGISENLIKIKQASGKLHYIGEWHSHPNSLPIASQTDKWQMQKFALRRLYGAQTPLLLIIGGSLPNSLDWKFSLHRRLKFPITMKLL
jgi:integrative and conjugative element protein (TIGR02256 family)